MTCRTLKPKGDNPGLGSDFFHAHKKNLLKRTHWILVCLTMLILAVCPTRGANVLNRPPVDPLFECPVTSSDIEAERAAAPNFLSIHKYEGYKAGMEIGNVAYAKECLKGMPEIDAKIEKYLRQRAMTDNNWSTAECFKQNLIRIRQVLSPLRKKHVYGSYWKVLHDPTVTKPQLAWLRVIDYLDREHPEKTEATTFNLDHLKGP